MKIKILFFGSLVEKTGVKEMMLDHQGDLGSLKEKLYDDYPAIKELTFKLAINTELINFNKELNDGDVVALLPPFAGG